MASTNFDAILPTGNTLGLKRLTPVADLAGQAANTTGNVYTGVRGYTPHFVEPYVKKSEELVAGYSAPVYNYAQDTSANLLKTADTQVDGAIKGANGFVKHVGDLHKENLKHYDSGKNEYSKWVHDTVDYAKDILNPVPYVNKTTDTVKSAGARAWEFTDPDVTVDTVYDVGAKVASFGPVAKTLQVAEPVTDFWTNKYYQLHNFTVGTPLYKKAYYTGTHTVNSVTKAAEDTVIYKKAKDPLHPYVYPLYYKFANSKYLNKLATHFEPK